MRKAGTARDRLTFLRDARAWWEALLTPTSWREKLLVTPSAVDGLHRLVELFDEEIEQLDRDHSRDL